MVSRCPSIQASLESLTLNGFRLSPCSIPALSGFQNLTELDISMTTKDEELILQYNQFLIEFLPTQKQLKYLRLAIDPMSQNVMQAIPFENLEDLEIDGTGIYNWGYRFLIPRPQGVAKDWIAPLKRLSIEEESGVPAHEVCRILKTMPHLRGLDIGKVPYSKESMQQILACIKDHEEIFDFIIEPEVPESTTKNEIQMAQQFMNGMRHHFDLHCFVNRFNHCVKQSVTKSVNKQLLPHIIEQCDKGSSGPSGVYEFFKDHLLTELGLC